MSTKRKTLGRGLDALLSQSARSKPAAQDETGGPFLRNIPVDQLQRGQYQPRQDMHPDTLSELADSIRAQGVVQPLAVRAIRVTGGKGEAKYEIIAGERRWRAAQMAGLDEVPAVIHDVPDEAAVAMALIENIQREDLNPLEEANALSRLIEEFELTHQQAGDAVGRSRAAVSNLLRLLELDGTVKALLEQGELEVGHARPLLALPKERQGEVARQIAAKGLSARAAEKLVKKILAGADSPPRPERRQDPDVRRLENDLADKLGAPVQLRHSGGGKGTLVIRYTSLDELDGILAHIK